MFCFSLLNLNLGFTIGFYFSFSAPVVFDIQFPLIDNPGNFCWFGQTLIVLKAAIDKQSFLARKAADGQDFPSPFHETLDHILELAATHVLDPRPILKDFLNYFVEEDHGIVFEDSIEVRLQKRQAAKDRLEARKRDYMTQQQEGETALDMLRNCPYLESIQISRQSEDKIADPVVEIWMIQITPSNMIFILVTHSLNPW